MNKMANENNKTQGKPSAYEEFKGVKSNALNYQYINNERDSGKIKEGDLRDYAAKIAPDQAMAAYLQNNKIPFKDVYPFVEKFIDAGYQRFKRLSDEMGVNKLEEIVDSTPKKNLRVGIDNLQPDSKNAGDYDEAVKNHKKYLKMNKVLAVYHDEDTDDEDREKASKEILKTIQSHYETVLSDEEPEVKMATQWLIENSQIFAGNMYAMMFQEAQHKFNEAIKGKEKDYVKTMLRNSEESRERFYQAILVDPKEKKKD